MNDEATLLRIQSLLTSYKDGEITTDQLFDSVILAIGDWLTK